MNGDRKWFKKCRMFAEQGGVCFYCEKPMIMVRKHLKRQPPELATIEHLDSRLSGERGKHPSERRLVLACFSCNQERGAAENAKLAREELHKRSGRAPAQTEVGRSE